jgi:thiol-disulfide isomerase/thioredoxin
MRTRAIFAVLIALLCSFAISIADQPKPALLAQGIVPKLPPGCDIDKLADQKEATKVADWLDKEYPAPQPESVKMLVHILRKGVQMTGHDGWFGPAASRYTWKWLAEHNGLEADAKAIPKDKFRGSAELFERLDRDGDGSITPSDLDWSDRNPMTMQLAFVSRLFRRLDTNSDGKITREDLDAFFKMAADGKDHITPEDLRKVLIPRSGYLPGDQPSTAVLVRGFFAGEIGSFNEGPKVGDTAPDFTLKTADGKKSVTLSKLAGHKPVVLVFGNFTCGPFRGLYPEVDALYERYKDQAEFVMVYVREAHPTNGWAMESNVRAGVAVKQPTTLEERSAVCELFRKKLNPGIPVVVDEITDPVNTAYSGNPTRLYVIDAKGKVAFKNGRGPFGMKPGEMEQALIMALLEANPTK